MALEILMRTCEITQHMRTVAKPPMKIVKDFPENDGGLSGKVVASEC